MPKSQTQKLSYFKELVVPDQQKDLKLCPQNEMEASSKSLSDSYYEVKELEKHLIITQFQNNQKGKLYQFSRKGNLAFVIHYNVGNKNYNLKISYDYSSGKKIIKEKRFYNSDFRYLKKESFDKNGKLQSITYYRQSIPYYVEHFDDSGLLLESEYYHENGLMVK